MARVTNKKPVALGSDKSDREWTADKWHGTDRRLDSTLDDFA